MKSRKLGMVICCVLLCLNLLVIWGNSFLVGETSAKISKLAADLIYTVVPEDQESAQAPNQSQAQPQEQETIKKSPELFHSGVRKSAHLLEFLCLGVLFSWLIRMLCKKNWQYYVLPLLCGVAVAAIDETIQLFIPERQGLIMDVGIDTLGIVLGIVLISIVVFIHKKTFGGKKI